MTCEADQYSKSADQRSRTYVHSDFVPKSMTGNNPLKKTLEDLHERPEKAVEETKAKRQAYVYYRLSTYYYSPLEGNKLVEGFKVDFLGLHMKHSTT